MLVSILAMTLLSAGLMCFCYNALNPLELPQPTDLTGALHVAAQRIAEKAVSFFGLSFGTLMGTAAAFAALIRRPQSAFARVAMVWSGVQALGTIIVFFL